MSGTGEILFDVSASGKERPWELHKSTSLLYAESYMRLYERNETFQIFKKRSLALEECGSWLRFNKCPQGHEMKLKQANFCRVRLCPMCSWRRSLKFATQVKKIAKVASSRKPLRYLFLTLTIENCSGDDLDETIKHLNKSWTRLSGKDNKYFQNRIVGWIKVLEITRNLITGEYHPHFHIMLAVDPDYFDKRKTISVKINRSKKIKKEPKYIDQETWVELWKKALKVDYDPVVDIRVAKNKRNKNKEKKLILEREELANSAISEIAKYATKSDDVLIYNKYVRKQKTSKTGEETTKLVPVRSKGIDENRTDENIFLLDKVLSGKRLIAFGGYLKEIQEELKMEDVESETANLTNTDEDEDEKPCTCSVCNSDMLEELYSWNYGFGHYMKK